ncbi:hypothetical protein C5167_013536 [Papaver somniferum]|uniref:Uncharacterized protein n=1 Tax=Papaver somniferum TaxID=3469 RepID=A0A4Y7J2K0_PAPSO|nr:hypothetical protein C5167_013536 [Papaver somniferum]
MNELQFKELGAQGWSEMKWSCCYDPMKQEEGIYCCVVVEWDVEKMKLQTVEDRLIITNEDYVEVELRLLVVKLLAAFELP